MGHYNDYVNIIRLVNCLFLDFIIRIDIIYYINNQHKYYFTFFIIINSISLF